MNFTQRSCLRRKLMRTRNWLWTAALVTMLPASFFSVGCGDSTNQGGSGGSGGTGASGGGNVGGQGTGGMTVSGNDTCDSAVALEVKQDEQTFVQGTLTGAADD